MFASEKGIEVVERSLVNFIVGVCCLGTLFINWRPTFLRHESKPQEFHQCI